MRSSNIELLRVFAMLMIACYHIVFHCVVVQLTDTTSIVEMENGWFNHPYFYKRIQIINLILPFGNTANNVFVLIAGFFTGGGNGKIDLYKISKKLIAWTAAASVFLALGSMGVYLSGWNSSRLDLIGLNIFNSSVYWFVGYYFLIVLFCALVLDKWFGAESMTREKYRMILVVAFALLELGWARGSINGFGGNLATVLTGIWVFSLGGYIRRYEPFKKVSVIAFVAAVILVNICILITAYNGTMTKINQYQDSLVSIPDAKYIQGTVTWEIWSFVCIILAICLFEIFRRIPIPNNRVINFLGASTFFVYLMHDNDFFYSVWDLKDWITLLYNHPYEFMFDLIKWTLCTFWIGVLGYVAFLVLSKIFQKMRKRYE